MSAHASGGCTPDGSVPVTATQLGFEAGDAATQAAAGEARVIGANQDVSQSGAGDAARSQATLWGGIANRPAATPVFTRDD